jgi:2-polyprenyl-3-methyl-5-hydroxy-6-metoxy-1,4-benzoquinol methylase
MSFDAARPHWRLPRGVNASLWHYAHTRRLAEDEDEFLAGHPLCEADRRALEDRFTVPGRLVDLGCGAGRLALQFARRGFAVTAVDLSHAMLQVLGEKVDGERL